MAELETSSYDNLIAGDFPIVTGRETLLSGQNLTRGALLGQISDSGASLDKLKQCDSGGADGSETPYAILVDDCDASLADAYCTVYYSGEFTDTEIGLATGDVIADFKKALRGINIYVKSTQGA